MMGGGGGGGPRGMLQAMGGREDGTIQKTVLLRLLSFVLPYRKELAFALVCMVIATGAGLLVPYLTRVIIDEHIVAGDLSGITRTGITIGAALLIAYASEALQMFILAVLGQKVLFNLRARLFEHLQRLSVAYNDTHIIGVTVSRVVNDVSVINNLLSEGLVTLIGDTILLAGTIAVMLSMDWQLALLTFSILPFMVLVTVWFSNRAKPAFRETREKVANLVGTLAENIGGMRVIQSYGQEGASNSQFEVDNRENRKAHVRAMRLSFTFLPAIDVLGVGATAIVLGAGGYMALQGRVSIGIIVAFMSYVSRFFVPIRELSQLFTTLQSASAGGERVLELLDAEPAVSERPGARRLTQVEGRIQLDHVGFSYVNNVEVLHDVSLTVEPGETIAIVGPTGAGKSTITNLVCRFYEVTSGRVLVDGTDVRDINLESLHRHMGYVSQDPILFPVSIAENIALGADAATLAQIEDAARNAEAHGFISRLVNGYDTVITEGASNLSVGQRQLIAIARAMLVDPRILIMDEATSSVDTVTEALIQRALDRLLHDRTAIVIAHRLTTIRNADRIYVIDQGRIVQSGTHAGLLSAGGMYRELYERQFIDGPAQTA
ncbi:MAG: ABC transporter ATP-binding protein [Spirochaetaceae bacterium]|nr:MAG: ABC transporter ATP-binding protein [Spirochaetaceae bacterium]